MPQWGWNRAAAFPVRQRAQCRLAFYLVRAGSSDRCLPVYNFSQLPSAHKAGFSLVAAMEITVTVHKLPGSTERALRIIVTCPCRFPPVEVRVRPSEGRTDEASQVYGRADYWRAA